MRLLLGALTAFAVAVALWAVLGGGSSSRPDASERPRGEGEVGSTDVRAGVPARTVTSAEDRVSGRVVDEDGQPIDGGSLVLSCLDSDPPGRLLPDGAVRIDADGGFEGPGCKGRVCAELRHPAMIQTEAWLLAPGRPVELRARLLDRLEGTVLDPEGAAVSGARLSMLPPPDDVDPTALPPFVSRNASTDGDGRFSFAKIERPPCDPCQEAGGRCGPDAERELPIYTHMLLTARADGFRVVETLVDATASDPLEIRLVAPAPPLTGALLDPDGRPYARARVLARSSARAWEQHGVEPAADGSFVFAELGEGSYELRAVQDGVELATSSGATAGGHVALAGTIAALGPDLELTVLDAAGHPLRDVVVSGGPFAAASTDAAGRVRAQGVMPGPYTLRIRGAGIRAFSREITVPESEGTQRVSVWAEGG